MKLLKTDSIRIAGFDYSVNYVSNSFGMGSMNRVGECNFGTQEITLNEHLHEDAQLETFLHELVHAIITLYAIPMPEKEEDEEAIVRQLGIGLFQVCKDNNLINPEIFNTEGE